jgi:tRNA (uracil-5-)-methyltransferase TRM9
MLRFAEKYAQKFGFNVELTLADVRRLPYPDDSFDRVIAVATYHHLMGGEHQAALAELRRVLKPGGEAFITVWNKCQPRFWFKPKEVEIPWRQKGQILYRRYYLFSFGELERLVKGAGFEVIKSSPESSYHFPLKLFSRNICLLVKKGE